MSVDTLLVNQYLGWNCFKDATFLAELIHNTEKNEDSLYLLCKCYHADGRYREAIELIERGNSMKPRTRLLAAQCSFCLRRFDDVERFIGEGMELDLDEIIQRFDRFAAPVFLLLGNTYRCLNEENLAIECFIRCLQLAPYTLSAYEAIASCDNKVADRYNELLTPHNVSKTLTSKDNFKINLKNYRAYEGATTYLSPIITDENLSNNDCQKQVTGKRPSSGDALKAIAPKIFDYCSNQTDSKFTAQKRNKMSTFLPRKTKRVIGKNSDKPSVMVTMPCDLYSECPEEDVKISLTEPILRKEKEFTIFGSRDSVKENTRCLTTRQCRNMPPRSSQQNNPPLNTQCEHPICKYNENNGCGMIGSAERIKFLVKSLSLLIGLCVAQKRKKFSEVIKLYDDLPVYLKTMHRCLVQKAIALTEMGQYGKAVSTYKLIRQTYPMHFESMAMYSTALWHLRAENDLVALAQVLYDEDSHQPEIDPTFNYAYTLLGNEYVVSGNHDLAVKCFRYLLHLDIRDYRGWYGIGSVCFARENYDMALVYFTRANAAFSSTVLMCHIAVTEHMKGHNSNALKILSEAIEMDPTNSLCRFHRAGILYSLNNLEEAIKELKILEEIVPHEALVFHMFAKVFRGMKNERLFLAYMHWAMKLDTKRSNNALKEAIDRFYPCSKDYDSDNFLNESFNNSSIPCTSPNELTVSLSRETRSDSIASSGSSNNEEDSMISDIDEITL